MHRKGATRAFGPGHAELPEPLRSVGQPVLIDDLAAQGILVRSPSSRGVAEEAPGASQGRVGGGRCRRGRGLARKVARLAPLMSMKG